MKTHLVSMKLDPVKIKKPDSAPWMCYINFKCEEDRQVHAQLGAPYVNIIILYTCMYPARLSS